MGENAGSRTGCIYIVSILYKENSNFTVEKLKEPPFSSDRS